MDRIDEPPTPSLFLSQRVRHALRFFYRHQQEGSHLSTADSSQQITEAWDEAVSDEKMQFSSLAEETALQQQAIGLVKAYLDRRDSDEGVPLAVDLSLECALIDPTTGHDLGLPLRTVVDLVLDSSNGPVLVNFKTSSRSSAPLEIAHEIQLACNAFAFRQDFGAAEHELQIRSLIKTKTPKTETHRYPARSDNHFQRLFSVIREYCHAVSSRRFLYRPSWTCSMCELRENHCRQWQG